MGNKPNWPAESCWLSTLGDRFTGPDWTQSILEGSGAKFTDEAFVKALTAFQELAQRAHSTKTSTLLMIQSRIQYISTRKQQRS